MAEDTLPPQGDDISNADQEQALLDAVMQNSPIMEETGIPLPDKEVSESPDPLESEEEVEDPESEEIVNEGDEEEVEEIEEEEVSEDDGEEPSTQTDIYTTEDLDLDAKVLVKIDGEEAEVSFGDLIKGYSTEQHLSKQGRELGEARKALDEEREQKLGELENIAGATVSMLTSSEQLLAKEYHDIEAKITKAREEGDTFELGELKDKREQAQQKYWNARKQRETLIEQVQKRKEEVQQENLTQQLNHFQEVIPDLIPDFNEDVAMEIRKFALDKGISEGLLDTVVDPNIVKFIDDYRRMEQNVSKGKAKRKAAPVKKAVPAKKAPPAAKKKADAEAKRKAKAFSDNASKSDQDAWLKDFANKSLSNI